MVTVYDSSVTFILSLSSTLVVFFLPFSFPKTLEEYEERCCPWMNGVEGSRKRYPKSILKGSFCSTEHDLAMQVTGSTTCVTCRWAGRVSIKESVQDTELLLSAVMTAVPKSWVQLGKHRLIATHLNTYDQYLWPLSAFDLEISNNRDNQGLAKPEIWKQRKAFKLRMVLNQAFLSTITLPWSSVLCFLNTSELQVAFHTPLHFHSSGDRHSPQVLLVIPNSLRADVSDLKCWKLNLQLQGPQGHNLQKLIFVWDIIMTHIIPKLQLWTEVPIGDGNCPMSLREVKGLNSTWTCWLSSLFSLYL